MKKSVQILLMVSILPAMCVANELLARWLLIQSAYDDILQVYPVIIWIIAILMLSLIVSIGLFLLERQKRRRDRANELKSLTDRQCVNVREDIEKRMQKEHKAKADDLKRQAVELAGRDNALKETAARLHCREQQVIAKQAELEKQLIGVANKSDQLTLWLSQVECAIEAMVEDHDTTGKISVYLAQWVEMAATDPKRFIAEVSTAGKFDTKRFDRSKRQLSNIYNRYAEIRQAMGGIEKTLQGVDSDATKE
jgi:hypothetical protein